MPMEVYVHRKVNFALSALTFRLPQITGDPRNLGRLVTPLFVSSCSDFFQYRDAALII